MKKLRVNKQYGNWYYNKIREADLEFPIYEFWNEDKTECYIVALYSQMLEVVKESSKELREEYIKFYC